MICYYMLLYAVICYDMLQASGPAEGSHRHEPWTSCDGAILASSDNDDDALLVSFCLVWVPLGDDLVSKGKGICLKLELPDCNNFKPVAGLCLHRHRSFLGFVCKDLDKQNCIVCEQVYQTEAGMQLERS